MNEVGDEASAGAAAGRPKVTIRARATSRPRIQIIASDYRMSAPRALSSASFNSLAW